ncbi:MAG: phosphoribosylformylglycinamidine synthase II, partial [Hyphomicrobiales bacterium]
ILPTPTIGGVGVLADVTKHATIAFKAQGEAILLIGETTGWLGQSAYLATICSREEGAPPPVDLAIERRNGDVVRGLITAQRVTACHDLSDGGLAVALAEMAMAGGIGVTINKLPAGPAHAVLFGEDQARYLITVPEAAAETVRAEIAAAGVPVTVLGQTGGDTFALPGETPLALSELKTAHETWLPAYMAGKAA